MKDSDINGILGGVFEDAERELRMRADAYKSLGATLQYYYKVPTCKAAGSGHTPYHKDCVCWHDVGKGPLYTSTGYCQIRPSTFRLHPEAQTAPGKWYRAADIDGMCIRLGELLDGARPTEAPHLADLVVKIERLIAQLPLQQPTAKAEDQPDYISIHQAALNQLKRIPPTWSEQRWQALIKLLEIMVK